jgi:hypothetical protein
MRLPIFSTKIVDIPDAATPRPASCLELTGLLPICADLLFAQNEWLTSKRGAPIRRRLATILAAMRRDR